MALLSLCLASIRGEYSRCYVGAEALEGIGIALHHLVHKFIQSALGHTPVAEHAQFQLPYFISYNSFGLPRGIEDGIRTTGSTSPFALNAAINKFCKHLAKVPLQ